MDLNEGSALGVFTCELCELSSSHSFYGQKPPNTESNSALGGMLRHEGSLQSREREREKFLVLGSKCCLCSKTVCVGTDCSLFYTKRFCLPCVRDHLQQFPEQIQNEVLRKKRVQKMSPIYVQLNEALSIQKHLNTHSLHPSSKHLIQITRIKSTYSGDTLPVQPPTCKLHAGS